jgi:hypothetical protein
MNPAAPSRAVSVAADIPAPDPPPAGSVRALTPAGQAPLDAVASKTSPSSLVEPSTAVPYSANRGHSWIRHFSRLSRTHSPDCPEHPTHPIWPIPAPRPYTQIGLNRTGIVARTLTEPTYPPLVRRIITIQFHEKDCVMILNRPFRYSGALPSR